MSKKPLWEETRDLHHACEQHPVGAAMASGTPPLIWYAAWVKALYQLHSVIDNHSAGCIHRVDQLQQDLDSLNIEIEDLLAASSYIKTLSDFRSIDGAVYVLTGAHLMGGEIMKRRLVGYPTKHLEWDDRKQSIAVLQEYRVRDDITQPARNCFQALLNIMDEIQQRYPVL